MNFPQILVTRIQKLYYNKKLQNLVYFVLSSKLSRVPLRFKGNVAKTVLTAEY